jgi:hypothetical protein
MIQTHTKPIALDTFCQSCPSADEVTAFLAKQGFDLVLHLGPSAPRCRYRGCGPTLPDQYHYRDRFNTDVIYLAGKDIPEEQERLPAHASRWWLYPGGNHDAYTSIKGLLALQWGLHWHPTQETKGGDA